MRRNIALWRMSGPGKRKPLRSIASYFSAAPPAKRVDSQDSALDVLEEDGTSKKMFSYKFCEMLDSIINFFISAEIASTPQRSNIDNYTQRTCNSRVTMIESHR